ncbi:MAG: OmpH family outer membrane protein [Desulfobacteraceae bacterium]|nr:OmpH family outer membrane protein [Desulfobacteraceae bacterium]
MKAMKIFGAILACTMAFAGPASAADVAKIGVVDFQKVIQESEAGQQVQERIQKQGRKMESELQELGKQIEGLQKQLSRDSMVMSKEKRQEKQREMEIKRYDFQSKKKEYESEFREMQSELVGKMQEEILAIAEGIGKKEGYLLIVEKNAAVYYPDSIEITDKVIKKYNEQFDGSIGGEGSGN